MQRSIFVLLLLLTTFGAYGQRLRGMVVNEEGKEVASAQLSVTDLRKDMVIWEGLSDTLGCFELPLLELTDSIGLSVWNFGYEHYTQLLNNSDKELKVVLNSILALQIDEVVVKGDVSPMRFEKGNIIVNVSKMKNFERLSTVQLMNRIPGLSVENGEVMLYGKPAVIYINGTKQAIPADAIMKYIESLPAKALADIKLISMPSSKYGKAEAVVEINIDSNMPEGIFSNTSVYGGVMDRSFGSTGISEFLMFKKGRVTFNTMLDYDNTRNLRHSSDSAYFYSPDVSTFSPALSDGRTGAIRSSSNLTVEMKNKSMLDFNLFVYYDQNKTQRDWSYTEIGVPTLQYLSDQIGSDDMYSITAKYATDKDRKHSLSLYYSGVYGSLNNKGDYFLQDNMDIYNGYLTTDYSMRGQQHNFTIDGVSNFLDKKLQFEYGLYVGANFLTDDTYDYNYDATSFQNSNRFKANELDLRAYARAKYDFSKNRGLSVDLGFDHNTSNHELLSTTSNNNTVTHRYNDFIPRITYWYRGSSYRLNLRLLTFNNRPNFNYLLAGQRYVNNYLYTQGNPNLRNEVTYSMLMGQTFWDFFVVNIYSGIIKNHISKYFATDSNGQLYQSYANASDKFYATANITLPFEGLDRKLYGSINALFQKGIYYNVNPVIEINGTRQHQFVIVYKGNIYYDITKRLTVESSISGCNRYKNLQSEVGRGLSFSSGISYAFLKDENLIVELHASNFLGKVHNNQHDWRFAGNSYITHNYAIPKYGLKLSYRFNKGKEVERRDNMGDLNRMSK